MGNQLTLPAIDVSTASQAGKVYGQSDEPSEETSPECLADLPVRRWPVGTPEAKARRLSVMGWCMCIRCYNGLLTHVRSL